MRLLLSGGSHRATLGAMGSIGYFLWSEATAGPSDGRADRWSDVDEVVSVSGGSILNAALAAKPTATSADTAEQLRDLRSRLAADGLLPHRTPKRIALFAAMLAVSAGSVWLLLAAFGVVGPVALSQSPWAVVIGLTAMPVVVGVERRLVTRYQRDVIDVVTRGTVKLENVTSLRRHIFCSSGLASGLPYYFVAGDGDEPFEPVYGTALHTGYSLADATAASTALPGLGRIRAPLEFRRELLVDGGVSGGLGEQVATTQIRRTPADTWRDDEPVFAVDAVRHMMSDSRAARLARSVSTTLLVARWLKVSLEATYVNDLIDLGPRQYARVWMPNELPPIDEPSPTVFRDGTSSSAPRATAERDGEERRRLGELQRDVSVMGLFSLNERTVDLGIVVGFVSTLEVRRGLSADEVTAGLSWLDDQLDTGGRLRALWAEPSRAASAADPR